MKTGWMDTENSIRTVLLRLGKASNPLICTTEVKIGFELITPTNADDPGNQNNNNKKNLIWVAASQFTKTRCSPP